MPAYRVLFFKEPGGHIDQAREFVADGDRSAINIAYDWQGSGVVELWQADRRVIRWEARTGLVPGSKAFQIDDSTLRYESRLDPKPVGCSAQDCLRLATILHHAKPYCGKHALAQLEAGEGPRGIMRSNGSLNRDRRADDDSKV